MELEYGVMESESDTSEYTESDEQEEHWEVNVDDIVKDFDVESDDDNENLTHTNGAALLLIIGGGKGGARGLKPPSCYRGGLSPPQKQKCDT